MPRSSQTAARPERPGCPEFHGTRDILRLGTTVQGEAFTAEDAMRLGHLGGWDVRKVSLTASEPAENGVTTMPVPGYATVRTNPFTSRPEALGVVGSGYTPLQNEEHAEFLNRLADESGAIFDTAGSLRGGRQVFVTMRLSCPSPPHPRTPPLRPRNAARERSGRLWHLFHHADTQAGVRGTAWAGYQSVVEYVDHFAPVRTKGDKTQARATRLLTTDEPARIKQAAWSALVPV